MTRVTRFGPKKGPISPKWDKSGAFSDYISVHLAPNSGFDSFGANLTHLGTKIDIPAGRPDSVAALPDVFCDNLAGLPAVCLS